MRLARLHVSCFREETSSFAFSCDWIRSFADKVGLGLVQKLALSRSHAGDEFSFCALKASLFGLRGCWSHALASVWRLKTFALKRHDLLHETIVPGLHFVAA
jgi:hypothetical protein